MKASSEHAADAAGAIMDEHLRHVKEQVDPSERWSGIKAIVKAAIDAATEEAARVERERCVQAVLSACKFCDGHGKKRGIFDDYGMEVEKQCDHCGRLRNAIHTLPTNQQESDGE